MLDRLLEFTHALRDAGVPVSVSENLDALRALGQVPMGDRATVRGSLAATMIKSDSHRAAFDTLFELYFGPTPDVAEMWDHGSDEITDEEFLEELYDTLRTGSGAGVREMARRAVQRFGRVEDSPSGSVFFEYPVMRAVDLAAMIARAGAESEGSSGSHVQRRVLRAGFHDATETFRAEVRAEVRRQVVARKGPAEVARHAVRPLLEDLDLATATSAEITELRRAIRPLARKLAARLAMKHRRGAAGRLDVRKTVRRSLSTGGVPFDLHLRHRVPHRPELFILCDVSSSVARYARFSLMLVHALASQFSRVRSFMFVDDIDEVTRYFEHEDLLVATQRARTEAHVVRYDDRSDYGSVLRSFKERFLTELGPRSTVLILGDARTNNRTPHDEVLRDVGERAKAVWWLNPESIGYWDTGDSAAAVFERRVDGMIEVRTLRQLEEFIARTL